MAGVRLRVGDAPAGLDYFVAAGQSNADGRGAAPYPSVPAGGGLEYIYSSRSFIQLAEPMQMNEETKGGPWAAFANEWKAQTGRQAVIHNVAVGASGQQDAGSTPGNCWDPAEVASNLYDSTITQVTAALADLEARPEPYTFQGILWDQGGRDGEQIDLGTPGCTKAGYKTAFLAMLAGWRTAWGLPNLPLFFFRLGRPSTGDTSGWTQIRDAQDELVASEANVDFAFTRAIEFPTDVPSKMIDQFHYTQAGYNEMGTTGAQTVAGLT